MSTEYESEAAEEYGEVVQPGFLREPPQFPDLLERVFDKGLSVAEADRVALAHEPAAVQFSPHVEVEAVFHLTPVM